MKLKRTWRSVSIFLILTLLVSNAISGVWIYKRVTHPNEVFNTVFELIERFYLNPIDITECRYAILGHLTDGFVAKHTEEDDIAEHEGVARRTSKCLDRFSRISKPQATQAEMSYLEGGFGGIGVSIKESGGAVIVAEVMKGGAAERAGVLANDVLAKVRQEHETSFINVSTADEAVKQLRGKIGTNVFVVIERNGAQIEMSLARSKVKISSVAYRTASDATGYVKISYFNKDTADDLEAALDDFRKKNITRVIIDLRDNPGGELYAPVEMLYYFSDTDTDIIFTERFKGHETAYTIGNSRNLFSNPVTNEKKKPGKFKDFYVAILINGGSASASELFSGVMKDWGSTRKQFYIVGGNSFGKGVGQAIFPLEGGASLSLTTFEFLVGNKKTRVHKVGVSPDIVVSDTRGQSAESTATAKDAQFQKAKEILEHLPAHP